MIADCFNVGSEDPMACLHRWRKIRRWIHIEGQARSKVSKVSSGINIIACPESPITLSKRNAASTGRLVAERWPTVAGVLGVITFTQVWRKTRQRFASSWMLSSVRLMILLTSLSSATSSDLICYQFLFRLDSKLKLPRGLQSHQLGRSSSSYSTW